MIKKQLLIIIPARSGSKTIKNKNTKRIKGRPLIEYTFTFVKMIKEKSKIIFCSTDSKKIQIMAKKFAIISEPMRPKKYSRDLSRDIDFVNHTLSIFWKNKIKFKYGLILRPTNPIRTKINVNKSYQIFIKNKNADSLKSVYPSRKTPFKSWQKQGRLLKSVSTIKSVHESYNAPRQSLPKTFDQTGTYEYFKIKYKQNLKSISGKNIMYFDVNKKESFDIDNLHDIKKITDYL